MQKGVFAIRTPRRPNPVGFSIVRLKEIRGAIISVSSLDILDGTPPIDINKPYIPQFDALKASKLGWFKRAFKEMKNAIADDRFYR